VARDDCPLDTVKHQIVHTNPKQINPPGTTITPNRFARFAYSVQIRIKKGPALAGYYDLSRIGNLFPKLLEGVAVARFFGGRLFDGRSSFWRMRYWSDRDFGSISLDGKTPFLRPRPT